MTNNNMADYIISRGWTLSYKRPCSRSTLFYELRCQAAPSEARVPERDDRVFLHSSHPPPTPSPPRIPPLDVAERRPASAP